MNELQWLAASALMTGLAWLLYVPNRIWRLGLVRSLGNPSTEDLPLADWAQRAIAAHRNAVENLVVFTGLVLAVVMLGANTELTVVATCVYFLARLIHLLVYVAGLPVVRTLAFAAGWICQLYVGLQVLGGTT